MTDDADLDQHEPKITWRAFPLDARIIAEYLRVKHEEKHSSIMIQSAHKKSFGRRGNVHYRPRIDFEGRWHIRFGKRGACVAYLRDCRVTYFDDQPTLYEFSLEE